MLALRVNCFAWVEWKLDKVGELITRSVKKISTPGLTLKYSWGPDRKLETGSAKLQAGHILDNIPNLTSHIQENLDTESLVTKIAGSPDCNPDHLSIGDVFGRWLRANFYPG